MVRSSNPTKHSKGDLMKSRKRGLLVVITLALVVTAVNADTLVLRDGRRVEGQLISIRDGVIEFQEGSAFGGGRSVRLNRDAVAGIEFGRNDRNPGYSEDRSSLGRRPSGMRETSIMVPANIQWVDTEIIASSGRTVCC